MNKLASDYHSSDYVDFYHAYIATMSAREVFYGFTWKPVMQHSSVSVLVFDKCLNL
jgi:hypothetical protein